MTNIKAIVTYLKDEEIARVSGNTFVIKDGFKNEGGRWNPILKTWDFHGRSEKFVKKLLKHLITEYENEHGKNEDILEFSKTNDNEKKPEEIKKKRKSDNSMESPYKKKKKSDDKKDWELRPYIDDAKELWNELMETNNIKTQKAIVRDAGVFVRYIPRNEFVGEWFNIIEFKDPLLEKYAEEIKKWLEERNIPVKIESGIKISV